MASVSRYETASGMRWEARYRTPERGSTRKRGFRTKRDAEAFLVSVEHSKSVGSYVPPAAGRITVAEVGKTWDAGLGGSAKTQESARSSYRVHVAPRWGGVAVSAVKAPAVRTWVADLAAGGLGAASIERALGVLRQILTVAVESGNLAANPALSIKPPRRTHKARGYLTHRQLDTLATAAGSSRPLVLFLGYSGLRFGEAAALRVQDVDTTRRRVRVERAVVETGGGMVFGAPKTHQRRSVPYPAFLDAELGPLLKGKGLDDLVFHGEGGSVIRLNNWRRRVFEPAVAACVAASVSFPRVTPHDLRHTCASLSIQAGANVKAIQTALGHSSAAMTLDTYADLFPDDLEAVAAALDARRAADLGTASVVCVQSVSTDSGKAVPA